MPNRCEQRQCAEQRRERNDQPLVDEVGVHLIVQCRNPLYCRILQYAVHDPAEIASDGSRRAPRVRIEKRENRLASLINGWRLLAGKSSQTARIAPRSIRIAELPSGPHEYTSCLGAPEP
jgi:hypothetical protein